MVLREEGPFEASGKAGSASAAESARLDEFGRLGGGELAKNLAEGLVSAARFVDGASVAVGLVNVREKDGFEVRHGRLGEEVGECCANQGFSAVPEWFAVPADDCGGVGVSFAGEGSLARFAPPASLCNASAKEICRGIGRTGPSVVDRVSATAALARSLSGFGVLVVDMVDRFHQETRNSLSRLSRRS
jgi:hypothetical protein